MKTYTYTDSGKAKWEVKDGQGNWVASFVYTCEAMDILEADKKFEAAIGKSPAKVANIGCSVKGG